VWQEVSSGIERRNEESWGTTLRGAGIEKNREAITTAGWDEDFPEWLLNKRARADPIDSIRRIPIKARGTSPLSLSTVPQPSSTISRPMSLHPFQTTTTASPVVPKPQLNLSHPWSLRRVGFVELVPLPRISLSRCVFCSCIGYRLITPRVSLLHRILLNQTACFTTASNIAQASCSTVVPNIA